MPNSELTWQIDDQGKWYLDGVINAPHPHFGYPEIKYSFRAYRAKHFKPYFFEAKVINVGTAIQRDEIARYEGVKKVELNKWFGLFEGTNKQGDTVYSGLVSADDGSNFYVDLYAVEPEKRGDKKPVFNIKLKRTDNEPKYKYKNAQLAASQLAQPMQEAGLPF